MSVIRDVKAAGGILICRYGFTRAAHTYARKSGVSLLNLHDAQSTNWSLQLTVPILWIELTPKIQAHLAAYLEIGDRILVNDPLGPPMTTDDGRTRIDPISTFRKYWNGPTAKREVGLSTAYLWTISRYECMYLPPTIQHSPVRCANFESLIVCSKSLARAI